MVVIKSCEDNITPSNEVLISKHPSDISSRGTMSNNIVKQDNECLVEPRVSIRLQNKPKINYAEVLMKRSRSVTKVSNSIQKKTKLKKDTNFLVCDELDFRCTLMITESLKLFNIQTLQSFETKQNKVDHDNEGAEKFLMTKATKYRGVEKHVPGLTVSKYILNMIRRMAVLGIKKVVHFTEDRICKAPSNNPCLVCRDLSNGQEAIAILVTNEYDDPPVAPAAFTYIKSRQVASNVQIPPSDYKCKCKGGCGNMKTCACARLNEHHFPYVRFENGDRLIKARNIVYECGPSCGCNPDCENRISPKDIKYRLEVYRTPKKGWGVRSWDFIPSGSPVCEYVGELKKNDDLLDAKENDYIFDIDCWETINGKDGREKRSSNVSLPSNIIGDKTTENGPEFSIDACSFGNVARFINHSCGPNLFVQCVLSSHYKVGLARLVLVASKDIHPYHELTYDYAYQLDSVIGQDGNIKQMPCYCGAAKCRKRLY